MFDRRLKIFLFFIAGFTLVLMLRTMQIQILLGPGFVARAGKMEKKPSYVDTVRGRILDVKGRVLAEDVPCIDAMVDYRAIGQEPDAKWLRDLAGTRLATRLGEEYTKAPRTKRDEMAKDEMLAVKRDLANMWATLAHCPGMNEQKVADARQEVVRRVENRVRWIWYRNYQAALNLHESATTRPWYTRLLLDEDKAPEMDEFPQKTIGDELIAYPIVHAIDPDTITLLGKNLSRFPGLSLQPSTHRFYPYKEAGCHWIGNLAPVTREERANDPNFADETRRYDYSDLIGRSGVEALAESVLRGKRGVVERDLTNSTVTTQPAVPGQDVRTTVDIELQQEIQDIFPHIKIPHEDDPNEVRTFHGAAVVIDVQSGQVRAMASYPTFDPNTLEESFSSLASDHLNQPLLNRATMDVLEPGSTVKPMVGLWGMKMGVLGVNEQIQCTGYMMYHGKKQIGGRCWVSRRLLTINPNTSPAAMINHPIPPAYPLGHDLTFADALERSCNPFHETIADRLGMAELSRGFAAFGLGQPTGIGIAERVGRLPNSYSGPNELNALWSAGIGQGQVAATPLQMANVVATIARGGLWLRPTLLASQIAPEDLRPAMATTRPARVDLQIPPEAIAMAHLGMWNVVHAGAGTGTYLNFSDVGVCGKTGTAQAAMFMVPELDENGKPIPKLGPDGKPIPIKGSPDKFLPKMVPLELGVPGHPNPNAPWYRGSGSTHTDLAHGWYIGFAPRQNPKIAFAVLVEYGGSGGITGAAVAHEVLAACVEHGYLVKEEK